MKTHQGMEIRATSVTGATSATAGFGHPVTKTRIARAIEWPTLALALGLYGDWLLHAGMVSLVVYWLSAVVGMPIWLYVVCFVYPGTALILLHSFIEHRPDARVSRRTAIVEAGPLLSLLYLNNNLHALHHARPDIAWYKLPAVYRDWRRDLLARNDGFRFSGYDEIARRFLLRAKDSPRHPLVD
jgi:fatty acid desaturase